MQTRWTRFPALLLLVTSAAGCHGRFGGDVVPEQEPVVVSEFTIEGITAVNEAELRSALATEESSWVPWGEVEYFDRAAFEADLQRIEAFYADRGFPHARIIETDVDVQEGGEEVALRIAVEEGEPVRVAAIHYAGFDVLPQERLAALQEGALLKVGEPLARTEVLRLAQDAGNALRDAGYAYADVDVTDTEVATDRIRLTVQAEPGILAYFGDVDVAGNASVGQDVILRQLTYRPGDRFDAAAIRESQRRLYTLGLFQLATIEVLNQQGQSAQVRTRVVVAERDHRQLNLSLGYASEEQVFADAEWRHVNFFGGARTAVLHGKWSWIDRGVEGTFVQPYLFRPGLSLELSGHTWYRDERAYRVLSRGGRTGVTYVQGPQNVFSATYMHEYETSRIGAVALEDATLRDELIALGLNPTTGEQDGLLSAVALEATRNTAENALDPKQGYRASIRLEQAGGWLPGSFNYYNVLGDARHYRTLGAVTLAHRVRYGSIAAMERPADVPFFKRYFLGGADSLRGWGRFHVGPLSGSGLPIGGHALFAATSEVRFPVAGNVGAAAFVDAGNVWTDAWTLRPADLLYDVGAGVRYASPVGPLRLDFAYQLTPIEGLRENGELQERRWRVHFSIGQAF